MSRITATKSRPCERARLSEKELQRLNEKERKIDTINQMHSFWRDYHKIMDTMSYWRFVKSQLTLRR